MKKILVKVGLGLGALILLAAAGGGIFVWTQVSAFDESMAKRYDIPVRDIRAAEGPEALARGEHLARSVGACAASDCHGADLAGGKTLEMGPLGVSTAPNITGGGLGAVYSDAELVRLIEHGIRKDGTSVRFMPAFEINWLPDDDLSALLAFIRSVPPVKKPNGPFELGVLAKILDRQGAGVVMDVARHIDHKNIEKAPPPTPTKEYGRFLAKGCVGCHGEGLTGGAIPGAPPEIPIPLNITPHETGLKGWTRADFDRLLDKGIRKDGSKLNPFMPIESVGKMNETERQALFAYLMSLPAKPFGNR